MDAAQLAAILHSNSAQVGMCVFFLLRNTSRTCTSCNIRHFSSEIDKQALMKQKKWLEAKIRVHELLSNYSILYSRVLAVHCVCSQAIDRCHEACTLLALKHFSATRAFVSSLHGKSQSHEFRHYDVTLVIPSA